MNLLWGVSLDATEIISALNEALDEEINHLLHEGGRPLMAVDGVLIYHGETGFLYAFELEVETFLIDGAGTIRPSGDPGRSGDRARSGIDAGA